MNYKILWHKNTAKDLRNIDHATRKRIIKKSVETLENNPHAGLAMKGEFKGFYRLRIGDYRIIYNLFEETVTIHIIKVGHRKDVYH